MADEPKSPLAVQANSPQADLIKQIERSLEAKGVFKGVPADKRRALATASLQVTQTMVMHHQGPLPDPEALARYGEIIPDGANRIMKMAEEQAKHRIQLESSVIN